MRGFIDDQIIESRDELQLPPNHTSLDYLQAVYRGQIRPEPSRMRAAIAALQFEHFKLGVSVTIDGGDLAERLDKAIERSNRVKLNGEGSNGSKLIEHS